jgi:hypothetical protein
MVVDCFVNTTVDDVDVVTLDVQTMHKLIEFATSTATRRRPVPFMDARSSPSEKAFARGMAAQKLLSVVPIIAAVIQFIHETYATLTSGWMGRWVYYWTLMIF